MHAHRASVPFPLSLFNSLSSSFHAHLTLLPLSASLFSLPLIRAGCVCRSIPLLPPFFSFPTVFLSLPCLKRSNPTLRLPTSSFSSATLLSLPHLLFSYQPGCTRIHILQAFMMAAAHLCEPACWAASSLPWAGSPLRTRAILDLPRLILYLFCLFFSLLDYSCTLFKCCKNY